MLPLTLRLHHAQLVLHAEQRAEHIGVEGGGVAFGGLIRDRARLAFGACGIDGGVEPAKARDSLVDQIAHVILVAHVGTDERGFGAEAAQLGLRAPCLRLPGGRTTTTFAPSLAKATAVARPMPVKAPVIKTTGLLMFRFLAIWCFLPAEHGQRTPGSRLGSHGCLPRRASVAS